MLSMPTALPIELMGPLLQGPAEIKALQQALKNLSVATQRPDIDPGPIDGTVGTQCVQSVIAAQTLISAELPSWAFVSLQAVLAAGAMTSKAKEAVAAAAVPLTVAANTAAVKFKKPVAVMPTSIGSFFGPGWYKTPAGMLLIAVAAFAGWKLFLDTPKKAA